MPQNEHDRDRGRIINVRKLAALDIALHGAPLILGEFAVTVVIGVALGIWLTLAGLHVGHSASVLGLALGVYLLCVALNYVPLLLYAVAIVRRKSARQEVAAELAEKDGHSARRYGAQSLVVFLPLVIPVLAILQEAQGRKRC